MPIQITREEYEKKFGVKPFVSTTTEALVDTKPAPIKITRAEWNAMQNEQVSPTFGQDTAKDFLDMGTGLNKAVGTAGRGILDTIKRPDLSIADKTVLGGSKAYKGISDFLGEAFVGLGKLALPQGVEDRIKDTLVKDLQETFSKEKREDFGNRMRNPEGGVLIDQETNQKVSDFIFGKKDDFTDRRANDPRFKEFTDAAGNYALGASELVGAGRAEEVVGAGLNKGADLLPDASDVKSAVSNALDERTALKRQQDLYNIENSYDKLRKDMNKSSDANSASRTRIAEADVWNNVVDTDGKMTTLGRGGAYDQYQKATIDGRESIVRDSLVREGATVNINELARALKTAVANTGLEGAALASALKGVQRELKAFTTGLSKRTDDFGNIPLEKVQDFKTSTTKTIDYKKDNTPTISFKKAKAQAYKEVIENKSKVEVVVDGKKYGVKGINAELAKYYQDLELIRSLDGKRVKGGKLGKYFAQISGNIIGGAAGGAVGGPVGMALGTIVGGEAGGFIKGRTMASSLGRGGKGVPANPVLDAARKEAGLPPVKDLNTPDKPLGAAKGIPKTKEITKVEGQIKQNVRQQKAAIKAGDFGLVAELKEVYAYLVIKLKELIKDVKQSIKNPTIGLSTKRVGIPEGTSYKDLVAMRDYADMVFTKKGKVPEAIADEMDVIAKRLKLKNAFGSEKALANEVNDILNDAQFDEVLQSKSLGNRNTQYNKTKTTSKTDIPKSTTPEPTIKTKREVTGKTVSGEKFSIPAGTVVESSIDGGKVNITAGSKSYVIPKNQYQNLVGQSDVAKASPFAPELEGTVETVRANGLKDSQPSPKTDFRVMKEGQNGTYYVANKTGKKIQSGFDTEAEAKSWLDSSTDKERDIGAYKETKYSQYTLPGGENYREILIQAPVVPAKPKNVYEVRKVEGGYQIFDKNSGNIGSDRIHVDKTKAQESVDFMNRGQADYAKQQTGKDSYRSSHWDEPNVISHIRMNERTVDGKKYDFMEEAQSDWAREGRDRGFTDEKLKPFPIDNFTSEQATDGLWYVRPKENNQGLYGTGKTEDIAIQRAKDTWFAEQTSNQTGVPNNPLLKNWQIPTIKRALMEAVDSGADRFAWINGEQTSARYNLATKVKEVSWAKIDGGEQTVMLDVIGGDSIEFAYDKNGIIGRNLVGTPADWKGKKLDEVLGKGLADKIMEKETGTLSGEGLKFGGEWASNLYDRQVRDIVKKLTGAEVKEVDLGLPVEPKKDFRWESPSGERSGWINMSAPEVFAKHAKVGTLIRKNEGDFYVITEVLGDGKFKAIDKYNYDKKWEVLLTPDNENGAYGKYMVRDTAFANNNRRGTFFESKKEAEQHAKEQAKSFEETFDISTPTANQQYIDLTPEVKAKIQSKAPDFKMKTPSAGYSIPLLLLMLGGGYVANASTE